MQNSMNTSPYFPLFTILQFKSKKVRKMWKKNSIEIKLHKNKK